MLDKIEISNFKKIQDKNVDGQMLDCPLILDKLAQVNYLVGDNGCGKSSVLEAIQVRSAQQNNDNYQNKISKLGYFGNVLKNNFYAIFHSTKGDNKFTFKPYLSSYQNNTLDLEIFINDVSQGGNLIDDSPIFNQFVAVNSYTDVKFRFASFPIGFNYDEPDILEQKLINFLNKYIFFEVKVSKLYRTFNNKDDAVLEFEDGKVQNLKSLSSGNRSLIELYFGLEKAIIPSQQIDKEFILSLEEPETFFHPALQKKLPQIFEDLGLLSDGKVRFIISTHSPFIINAALEFDHQKVYHLKDGQCTNEEGLSKKKLEEIGKIDHLYNIYGSLGMQPSDLLFSNTMIWVEGPTDAIYIEFWLKKYSEEKSLRVFKKGLDYDFSLFGGASAENFYLLEDDYKFDPKDNETDKIFDMLKIHPRSFVVIDNDNGSLVNNGKLANPGTSNFEKFKQKVIDEFGKNNFWYDTNKDKYTIECYKNDVMLKPNKKGQNSINNLGNKKTSAIKYLNDNQTKPLVNIVKQDCYKMLKKIYDFIEVNV
jgi:predicted ATP-dependent endonuclease of OLD family